MVCCAIYNCKNESKNTSGITYHRFPKDPHMSKLWVIACCRHDKINLKYARICSQHFLPESYKRDLTKEEFTPIQTKFQRNLRDDAVPTQNIPRQKKEMSTNRSARAQKRLNKKLVAELIDTSTTPSSVDDANVELIVITPDIQTEFEDMDSIDYLKKKISILENEKKDLEQNLKNLKLKLERQNSETLDFNNKVKLLLSKFFTKGQILAILENKKSVRWSTEDIEAAISLWSISPKAYRYLRDELNYPFPACSTLKR